MIFEPEIYEQIGGRWVRVETGAMKAVKEAEQLRLLNESVRARAYATTRSPIDEAILRDARISLAVQRPWPLFKSMGSP